RVAFADPNRVRVIQLNLLIRIKALAGFPDLTFATNCYAIGQISAGNDAIYEFFRPFLSTEAQNENSLGNRVYNWK
ncbi:MAG: hypothetical protein ORN98_07200, partial [Alphaproteobacteria bacterium]|nr:hypothetical protein [Alphaproteobacteria bacterium]